MIVFMEVPRTRELLQMVTLNLRQVSSLCKFRKACFLYTFCSHLDTVKSYKFHSPTSQVRPQSHHTKDCMTRKVLPSEDSWPFLPPSLGFPRSLVTWRFLQPSVFSFVLHTVLGYAPCWGLRLRVFDSPHYNGTGLPGKMEITTAVKFRSPVPRVTSWRQRSTMEFQSQLPADKHEFKEEPKWQSGVTVTLARERGPGVGLCWVTRVGTHPL